MNFEGMQTFDLPIGRALGNEYLYLSISLYMYIYIYIYLGCRSHIGKELLFSMFSMIFLFL